MDEPPRRSRFPLAAQIALAILAGFGLGALLGKRAEPLGAVGLLVIRALKLLAGPLVFFAVLDSVLRIRIAARQGARLIAISALNAAVAATIALSIAHALPVGRAVDLSAWRAALDEPAAPAAPPSLARGLEALVPESLLEPFLKNEVLALVVIALVIGLALRKLADAGRAREDVELAARFASLGVATFATILGWIVRVVPIAVLCVIAKVSGTSGLALLAPLVVFVGVVTLGFVVHAVVWYSILLAALARTSPLRFFGRAVEPLLTAFGTGSSLATLPVTLRTLDEKMSISPASARLAACIGTNLNHDGILLYEVVAALFVAQAHGLELSLSQDLALAATATLAAIGIAGVPDAGLITLSLVLSSVGLPLAAVPLLLPVDWLLGRLRAVVNVTSDLVVAHVLDRLER